jgi:hypothetical protein
MFPKPLTLPGDDGLGLDSPETGMRGPEELSGGMKLWSVDRLLVNGQLMLKRQDLQVQQWVGTNQGAKKGPPRRNHEDHGP